GFASFMRQFAGGSFSGGLYRIHACTDILKWTELSVAAFDHLKGRIAAFASDWLGRQFALDWSRHEEGEPTVMMLDVGSAAAAPISHTFRRFHERYFSEESDTTLARRLYDRWLSSGGSPPTPCECVGYRVALYLGGDDDLANRELSNMEIYWSINGQILTQVRDLP